VNRPSRSWLLLPALVVTLVGPTAAAQEYATETGDLELETTITVTITLSGDGFVPNSIVFVTATIDGVEIELGTIPTDELGAFAGEIVLPGDLEPGTYTIVATGVTEVGATRVLTSSLEHGLPEVVTEDITTTTRVSAGVVFRDRGSGLEPLETTEAAPSGDDGDEPGGNQALVAVVVGFTAAAGAGAWWWIFRLRSSP